MALIWFRPIQEAKLQLEYLASRLSITCHPTTRSSSTNCQPLGLVSVQQAASNEVLFVPGCACIN
jgi:hypothetical protein